MSDSQEESDGGSSINGETYPTVEHHPWRRRELLKSHSKQDRRRRRSFSSDVGLASDDDLIFDATLQETSTTDEESDDQRDAVHPSLLSLPRVVGDSSQDQEEDDDGTASGTWKTASSEENEGMIERNQRLRHAGLVEERTDRFSSPVPNLKIEVGPVLSKEEGDEDADHEFVTVTKELLKTTDGTLKPKFSWEKSDDSDLEDIVYEADTMSMEDEITVKEAAGKLNLDLSGLAIPALATTPSEEKQLADMYGDRPPLKPINTRFSLKDNELKEDANQISFESIRYETDLVLKDIESEKHDQDYSFERASHETTSTAATSAAHDLTEKNRDFPNAKEATNFAVEHRILMKAIMELLGQQDKYATAVDMNDPTTIKFGPLKKATHLVRGAWKNKYVEIRKGMFSYYDDSISKDECGGLERKNIPLHVDIVKCRAVKLNTKSLTHQPGHAIFELTVEGGQRRFWMANSREDRLSWIRAIQDAMIGNANSGVRGVDDQPEHTGHGPRKVARKSPYKKDLRAYLRAQREVKNSMTKQSYVAALSNILGVALSVPVRWITQQNGLLEETSRAFFDEGVTRGVGQLWKDLSRDSVRINGELIQAGSGHAPERIVGALARALISQDRSSPLLSSSTIGDGVKWNRNWVTELQAMSYARDILLSGNRTRSGGDSYYCVDALCQNPGLVVLVPNSLEAEPLKISASHIKLEKSTSVKGMFNDRNGWLRTRGRPNQPFRKHFFVLTDGTLSFYEQAEPRPHKFRGQISIKDATIRVIQGILPTAKKGAQKKAKESLKVFMVSIRGKEGFGEREILFETLEKFLVWTYAFESTLKKKKAHVPESPNPRKGFRKRHKSDGSVDRSFPARGFILSEGSLQDHAALLGVSGDISSRVMALSDKFSGSRAFSTVEASVEASTTYNICTVDPQGNDEEDTWAKIKATFTQTFRISGGPNGRLFCGEEVVRVTVVECDGERAAKDLLDTTLSPRSRGAFGRKLWRHGSGSNES